MLQPSAGVRSAQLPSTQTSPTLHTVEQPPQCSGFLPPGQKPEQLEAPNGQLATHAPRAQTVPEEQAVPHAPQFAGSSVSAVQVAPQRVSPAEHAQAPPEHCSPTAQAWLHPPQCFASRWVSMHALPQRLVPPGQSHAPASQNCVASQRRQLAPQWSWSVERSQQRPSRQASVGFELQTEAQAPRSHFCPEGQTLPQSPQFEGSTCTRLQLLAQAFSPGAQAQEPARQPAFASVHPLKHPPHEPSACCWSMQRMLHIVPRPSQSHLPSTHATPGAQNAQPMVEGFALHSPDTHSSVALQWRSHAPQLAGSAETSAQVPPQSV